MSFDAADLQAIDDAIASGELRVQYRDRLVEYRSIKELLMARTVIQNEVSSTTARHSFIQVSKG